MTEVGPHSFTKIRAVIGAMLLNLIIGSYYAYGNYNIYVANYLISKGNEISTEDTLYVPSIWLVCQSITTAFSISIANKFGYRTMNFVSFLIPALCSYLTSYITNYYVFVVVYSLMNGIGIGLGYLTGLYIAWTYYPDKKSVVTGIILFTAGISATIISPLTTYIVNPNDKDYADPEVLDNVPKMFRVLCYLFLGLTLAAGIITPPPYESPALKEMLKHDKDVQIKKKNREKRRKSSTNDDKTVSLSATIKETEISNFEEDIDHQIGIINRYNASRELDAILGDQAVRLIGQLDDTRVSGIVQFGLSLSDDENISEEGILVLILKILVPHSKEDLVMRNYIKNQVRLP